MKGDVRGVIANGHVTVTLTLNHAKEIGNGIVATGNATVSLI
jgi:hypothetical protein